MKAFLQVREAGGLITWVDSLTKSNENDPWVNSLTKSNPTLVSRVL